MSTKVLLISYNFPPLKRAGSMRTAAWFDNFSEDIDITVVTRNWHSETNYTWANYFDEDKNEDVMVKVSHNKRILKIANKHNWFYKLKNNSISKKLKINRLCLLFEVFLKWTTWNAFSNERGLYEASRRLMKTEKFDLIIASGEPFVQFNFAFQLNKEFKIPYILDYRDPWIHNVFRRSGNKFGQIHIEKRYERLYAKNAILLTTISTKNMDLIQKNLSPESQSKFAIVPNGIDDSLLQMAKNSDQYKTSKQKFILTFIGTLYPQHNVHWLLNSLNEIIESGLYECQPIIRFVGSMNSCPPSQKEVIENFALKHPKHIELLPQVPKEIAWEHMFNSDLLIKFNAFAQEDNHFGKKLYEYAASKRLVLSINYNSEMPKQSPFFNNKNFQIFCGSTDDVNQELIKLISEKNSTSLTKLNNIQIDDLMEYSNSSITKRFETIIQNKIIKHHV